MCSMKCTGEGAFSVAGAVCSAHCAVCSLLPATDEDLGVEKD